MSKFQDYIDGLRNPAGSAGRAIRAQASALVQEVTGEYTTDSLEDFSNTVMAHLKEGNVSRAAHYVGHQLDILIHKSEIATEVVSTLSHAYDAFIEIAHAPKEKAVEGLKSIAKKCSRSDNTILKAVGTICKGFAAFLENPGKELKAVGDLIKDGLTTLYNASIGKAAERTR